MIKIVTFQSGLGNQIFQYVFYLFLKSKSYHVYPYYITNLLNEHYGLEVHKILKNVNLKKTPTGIYYLAEIIKRYFPQFTSDSYHEDEIKHLLYKGYYFNKFFFDSLPPNSIELDFANLSTKNKEFIKKNKDKLLVSIHFRRGDYLKADNIYGNICTTYYYAEAIKYVNNNFKNVMYVIFSDDIQYVEENFKIENANYVTWNQGTNSYMDLLLMACCPINIIANSSFSYWAARLNPTSKQVIYPYKWWHYTRPDIFPDSWLGLPSEE